MLIFLKPGNPNKATQMRAPVKSKAPPLCAYMDLPVKARKED